MDRTDLFAALEYFENGGMLYTLAEAIAGAQQELEHSTDWETCRTRELDCHGLDGEGWAPFAADGDGDVYWRRPRPKENSGG